MRFEVILLEPAAEFIAQLGAKLLAKILRTLELVQHFGAAVADASREETGSGGSVRASRQAVDQHMPVVLLPRRQEIRRAALLRDRYVSGDKE